MKRFVIAPIIGDGSANDGYRASVADLSNVNVHAQIPTDTQGDPLYNFALTNCGSNGLSPFNSLPNLYVFPDYPLDGQLGAMESVTRAAMIQSIEAYDFDGNGFNLDATTPNVDTKAFGEFVDDLGKQIDGSFTVTNFDVSEPS